jgi:hypothetical protein
VLGAKNVKQPVGCGTAQHLVGNREGEIIRARARNAQAGHANLRLHGVRLVDDNNFPPV